MQLCGRLVVELDGERWDAKLPGPQGRTVFAYLTVNRHRAVSRDELMAALWPVALPAAAGSALSAVLSRLRRVVGPSRLTGRDPIVLDLPAGTTVDVESAASAAHLAEALLAAGRPHEAWWAAAVPRYVGGREFLPGQDGEWVEQWRTRMRDLHLRGVEAYGRAALQIGGDETHQAVRDGRELVAAAAYRESGWRLLMSALAAEGNLAEALVVYEELRRLLANELGTDPAPETRALHADLLGSDAPASRRHDAHERGTEVP